MLEVFDKQRRLIGILHNAYGISEELKINAICYFSFSLPFEDFKINLCKPFNFVRYNKGKLYRILPSNTNINEVGDIQYKCEHVFALLIDDILENDHVIGGKGYYTRDVIQYILKHQEVKNWVLGECDFSHEYEYGMTDETLVSALVRVRKPFVEKHLWVFDDSVYPYRLNLKKINDHINPQMYIRGRKNLISMTKTSDPTSVCTRLYARGAGEGINKCTIKNVNNGLPYIQSPQAYIDKYGLIKRVWTDRRYTDPRSLFDAAKAMLNELQEPFEEYQVEFATLGRDYYDVPDLGKIVEIVGYKKTYITGITYNYDEIEKSTLQIANRPKDMASTIADMQDRQRIEMAYSQGATQFYQDHVYDNADAKTSLILKLMLPTSMTIINAIKIDVEVGSFRKPFTVTGGGGGQTVTQSDTTSSGASSTTTTADGGGETSGPSSLITTEDGGSTNSSTADGGGRTSGSSSITTSGSGGGGKTPATSENVIWSWHPFDDESGAWAIGSPIGIETGKTVARHSHAFNNYHSHKIENHTHGMQHTHNLPTHKHNFTVDDHRHDMQHTHNINSHTHDMQHYHSIAHTHTIPNHVHNLDPGISLAGNPSGFDLIINGIKRSTTNGRNLQADITNYLIDEQRKIPRDTYHKIEILPNDPAYVMLTINVQGFIQSRGDKTV